MKYSAIFHGLLLIRCLKSKAQKGIINNMSLNSYYDEVGEIMAKNKMGEKTKDKILKAAKEIFEEKGYDNTKVDEIAEKAGVTKAMIYYHFESKESIVVYLIKQLLEVIQNKLKERVSSENDIKSQNMYEHIEEMLIIWKQNKGIISLVLEKMIKDPVYYKEIYDVIKQFYNYLINLKTIPGDAKRNLTPEAHINLFFFNTLPMISYPLFAEEFIKEYEVSEERVREAFVESFLRVFYQNIDGERN